MLPILLQDISIGQTPSVLLPLSPVTCGFRQLPQPNMVMTKTNPETEMNTIYCTCKLLHLILEAIQENVVQFTHFQDCEDAVRLLYLVTVISK